MELIVTRADNSNYNLPSENSTITSAVQTRTLMGEDTVAMTVQSVGYINFLIGDWIEVFGRKYTLNTLGEPQRIGENTFEYNLVFEGVNYELTKVVYRSADYSGFNPTSDFPLTGTAEAFLTVLQYNLDRAFGQGIWAIGSFPATDAKTLSFTSENCLLALNRVCSEFGLEYEIKTIGGVKTINLGAVGDTLPLNLEYGKGKGLYSLTRTNVDSKNIVTRLYVEGSDRNVKAGYRDNALRLRIAANAESYIDSPSVASFGIIEGSKIFEDILPHREGTVSAINASDVLEFTDSSMDFDLAETDSNGTKWLIAGQSAKIHFNTGALAGYEFELTAYNHSTKTFKLKPFKDERGLQFPNPDSAAFQIKTGDKYVILDIIMPDAYIQAAEAELLAWGQEYLSQNDQPRVEYSLDLDRFFLKSMFSGPGFDVNFLDAGDYLHIKDSKIGVDKEVRVKTFTRDVIDPWVYQVTLSDVIEPTRIELLLADTLETKKAARQSKLFDPARTRRNWRDVEEVAGMVDTLRAEVALIGSPEGQFQLDSFFEVNKGGNPDSFGATAGVLAHDAFEGDAGSIWNIGAFEATLTQNSPYYLYAKCSKATTGGVFTVSLTKIEVDSDPAYYHFPVGIISSVKDNARTLTTVYGYTLISGNNINTGIIQNQLSGIYINLQTGEIRGNIKFTSGVSVENAITDQQIYIEYSVNGSTGWHTTFTAGDLYMRQKKGAGAWSAAIRIVGEAGAAGATGPEGRYTDYQFAKNTSATTAPTSGWQDSPPAVSAGEYVWMRTGEVVPPATSPSSWSMATRVTGDKGAKGDKGDQGVQGIAGPKGADGVTYYTWVKYADSPTSGMSDYPSGKAYMGLAHNKTTATESSNYADYTWSLIKGTDGQPGAPGANGQTLYTWIKYADTPTSGMSDSPTGKTYIGLAVNKTTASESSSYGDYTWSLIKGADGRSVTGTDVEFAQSTSATVAPTSGWQTTAPAWESGKYIWHRTKTTYSTGDPTYSAAVNLTGSPGSTGSTGATGTGVDSITEEYYLSTSKTTQAGGSWSVNPPTWEMGKYMWTRVKIVYKNPASTVYTTPVVSSEWEAVDAVQVGGRNLVLNSSFERPISFGSINGGVNTVSTEDSLEGSQSWKCVTGGSTNASGGYIQKSGFKIGETYTLSVQVKSIASAPVGLRIVTTGWQTHAQVNTSLPAGEWVKVTLTFVAQTDTYRLSVVNGAYEYPTYYIDCLKLELGNRATDWTPAPEDVDADIATAQTAADNANASVTSLNTYVDGAFKDGVIDTAEAKAIEKYKNNLAETKLSVDGSYTQLYNNAYLTGTPKSNLSTAKTAFNTAYTNLVNSINTAIADGKTTAAEKSDVDSKFGLFNTAMATYKVRAEEAQAAINVKLDTISKGYVDAIEIGGVNLLKDTNRETAVPYENTSKQTEYVNVERGKQYALSFDIKATGNYQGYTLLIQYYDANNTRLSFEWINGSVTTQYQRLSKIITMPTDPAFVKVSIGYRSTTPAGQANTFKCLQLEKGNKVSAYKPSHEDVPSALEYLATAIQDGSTDIEGGLVATNVLQVKDLGGQVRGGMSGLANDNIGFWTGGDYQDALDGLCAILFRKDGTGHIGKGAIRFKSEGIELGDMNLDEGGAWSVKENESLKLLISRGNIMSPESIYAGGQSYEGTFGSSFHNVSGEKIEVLGTYTILNDGTQLTIEDCILSALIQLSAAEGYSTSSIQLQAHYPVSGSGVYIEEFSLSVSGTTEQRTGSKTVNKTVTVPAGNMQLRVVFNNINHVAGVVAGFSSQQTAGTIKISHNTSNPHSEIGRNGFMFVKDSYNFVWFGVDNSSKFRAVLRSTGDFDMPGVLLRGTVDAAGGNPTANWWGPKKVTTTPVKTSTGRYVVYHNVGHVNYTVSATPRTANRSCHVVSKDNTQFIIEWRSIGSSPALTDTEFDFQISGLNFLAP